MTAQILKSMKNIFLEITLKHQNYVQILSDCSKVDDRFAVQQCHLLPPVALSHVG